MKNTELKDALKFFSARFHRESPVGEEGNYISSPIGAWILLAQVAGGNHAALSREETEKVENALGLTIPAAYDYANYLIKSAPPAIKAASAAWFNAAWPVGKVGATWIVNTEQVGVTDVTRMIPTKQELDDWANENTLGLISEFPFTPDSDTVMILANALATKIEWTEPFLDVDAGEGSPWEAKKLLLSRFEKHHKHFFTDNEGNLFAVLTAEGNDLSVHAIIADDPALSAKHVLEIAEAYAAGEVFTLAAPDTLPANGNIFAITESSSSMGDIFSATLPAWDAEAKHDLIELGFPYAEGTKAVSSDLNYKVEALQVAKAKFSKLGFEAAAISALTMRATGLPRYVPVKQVEISFNHSFAVVASHSPVYRAVDDTAELWDSLPVFSAWVVTASEVE